LPANRLNPGSEEHEARLKTSDRITNFVANCCILPIDITGSNAKQNELADNLPD
jgi:hypothetical protein